MQLTDLFSMNPPVLLSTQGTEKGLEHLSHSHLLHRLTKEVFFNCSKQGKKTLNSSTLNMKINYRAKAKRKQHATTAAFKY